MRKTIVGFLTIFLAFAIVYTLPAQAATKPEIDAAIADGVAWLAAQQQGDGSWPNTFYWGEPVAYTGLAVLKLEQYAYELGYASPFDPEYLYHQNVEDGLNYIFGVLLTEVIGPQDHTGGATGTVDNPDSNGNGLGVYGHGSTYPFDVYDTGIVLSAVSASGTPNRVVSVIGSPVNTWKYSKVAQDMADWLAWAQSDFDYAPNSMGEGGWSYEALDNDDQMGYYGPDNSNGGYATFGLGYATSFGCTVPAWVKTELNAYTTDIQDPVDGDLNGYDGGSWYEGIGGGVSGIAPNILKTGNLIFEMAFVGDTPATLRVADALDYLARHWGDASGSNQPPGWDGDPANYQAMFCAMKGLEYMGITTLPGDVDWYADFSDKIVAQQDGSGAWLYSSERGDPVIITAWALLTLEKVAPPLRVYVDIKPASWPNPINVGSKGVLPVAICGTEDFDVMTIDPATVKIYIEGNEIGVSPIRWTYADVATPWTGEPGGGHALGGDGYLDLVFYFSTQEVTALDLTNHVGQTIPLTIKGTLSEAAGGTSIQGQDYVWIIKPKT
jgi:hypothetical protein